MSGTIRLAILVVLTLGACENSNGFSGLISKPLEATITDDCERQEDGRLKCCADPIDLLNENDWKAIVAIMGLELKKCGEEKGVAVDAAQGVSRIIGEEPS